MLAGSLCAQNAIYARYGRACVGRDGQELQISGSLPLPGYRMDIEIAGSQPGVPGALYFALHPDFGGVDLSPYGLDSDRQLVLMPFVILQHIEILRRRRCRFRCGRSLEPGL